MANGRSLPEPLFKNQRRQDGLVMEPGMKPSAFLPLKEEEIPIQSTRPVTSSSLRKYKATSYPKPKEGKDSRNKYKKYSTKTRTENVIENLQPETEVTFRNRSEKTPPRLVRALPLLKMEQHFCKWIHEDGVEEVIKSDGARIKEGRVLSFFLCRPVFY